MGSSYNYDSLAFTGILGVLFGSMITFVLVFAIAFKAIQIIAMWKIFTKAGQKGWKSIIPIYNIIVLLKISGISPWVIFAFLVTPIPLIGWCVALGLNIYLCISLAKAYGQGGGFAVGLILLPSVFYLILGFGSSEYQLDKAEAANI